ncbi:TetR/AcrR family transcriptional regulator [Cellulomonas sp. URHE0023]|uniref:TetR/AcrR family transcriptional regulator n=1 Tax=Cellulomonas sp. URHE0023 TaxID=1380354 RepID=UPI00068D15F9|nr:TetR/AcrR family transcriptional regulator [Cellulomonas sp. URHE0023]
MTGEGDRARMDPRVLRTRRLLQEALLTLARQKPFSEITVADVTDRATVNRSTFYQHYPDTDTLLADALDMQASQFGVDLAGILPDAPADQPPDVMVRYAVLMSENLPLYRDALGPHGSAVAVARLHARFRQLILDAIAKIGGTPAVTDIPPELHAAAMAGSIIGVLGAWIQLDPLPPAQDAARWAWSTVTGRTLSAPVDHRHDAYG